MKQRRTLSHYELVEKIGEGGMGEVWRAVDARLEREVAVKLLPESCTADPTRVARFEREAKLASQLSHPNIATIYEAGEADGSHFIAMELVRGETLAEKIRVGGLPSRSVYDVASAVAEGLAEAHRAGIVHRDLKPGNVMLDERGRVKILDFGLSRPQSAPDQLSDLTATGQIVGTPHYMSPEQVRGDAVDGRSDLFALGAILYELATGVKPFEGASGPVVISAVLEKDPPPVMRVNPHVG
jgi:serine/threonine protein kinase